MYNLFTKEWRWGARTRVCGLCEKTVKCFFDVKAGVWFTGAFPFALFKKVALQGGEDHNNNSTIYIIFTQHFKLDTCQKKKKKSHWHSLYNFTARPDSAARLVLGFLIWFLTILCKDWGGGDQRCHRYRRRLETGSYFIAPWLSSSEFYFTI